MMSQTIKSLLVMAVSIDSVFGCVEPTPIENVDVMADLCSSYAPGDIQTDLITPKACPSSNLNDQRDLELSLANGLFGMGSTPRDCNAYCVFNIASESHFRWHRTRKCWKRSQGQKCRGSNKQGRLAAVALAETFCPVPGIQVELPGESNTCIEVKTTPLDDSKCPGQTPDRSTNAIGCDAADNFDIHLALVNDMWDINEITKSCSSKCLYSALRTVSYFWSERKSCWKRRNNLNCGGNTKKDRNDIKKYKKQFCLPLPVAPSTSPVPSPTKLYVPPPEPVEDILPPPADNAPTVAVVEDEAVGSHNGQPCIPIRTNWGTHEMNQFCSHDQSCQGAHTCVSSSQANRGPSAVGCDAVDTFDIQLSLGNGMFGGGDGLDRDCSAWCLFDLRSETSHFQWRPKGCWARVQGTVCGAAAEHAYITQRRTQFCPAPAFNPPNIPDGGAGETDGPSECVQVRNELTAELMDTLCAHEKPCENSQSCVSSSGTQRGPDAQACDPGDNHNLRLSLANGLFGGHSGVERECGAWCVFDYIDPKKVVYKWEKTCWKKKVGRTERCGGISQAEYAIRRQSILCPPTMAPTVAPTHSPSRTPTFSPTRFPTEQPTSSYPTIAPSFTMPPTSSSPTLTPSISPTTSPSISPTVSPTMSPTVSPSLSPSTSNPTVSPSVSPTISPTTSTPTVSPSLSPTESPTTSFPTISPSVSPSFSPSTSPTFAPTIFCFQFNYSLTSEIAQAFCPGAVCSGNSCIQNGRELGPAAVACKAEHQDSLLEAIANGMFGGSDYEKDCDSPCVWDATNPDISYKWDGKLGCYEKRGKRCGNNKVEKQYAWDHWDMMCPQLAPHQQLPPPAGRV